MGSEDQLIIVCHHLIADGQSVSLLAERITECADPAGVDGEPPIESDMGFVTYQQARTAELPAHRGARRESFWRENLSRQEAPDLSHWLRPAAAGTPGRELRLPVPASLRDALRASAREAEVSEYTVYLGMFGLLLARYSHTDHVSVATPFTDRSLPEMEASIGCFVRTLPVHIDAGQEQSVRTLLQRLSKEILGAWKNLDYPVTRLLHEYPGLGRVFDITFIQDSYPGLPDNVLGTVRDDRVNFPGRLTVLVERIGDNSELVIQYKESALTAEEVRRFAVRYLGLLTQIPDALDAPVATLTLLSGRERTNLLATLSGTHYFDWEPTDLGTTFLAKTSKYPDRMAWSDESGEYSNAWAHDAAVLVQRRIADVMAGERRPVAILLPRGISLLAGVFGVVLAGCPYVPLSEKMPAQQLAEVLSDAAIPVILTVSSIEIEVPEGGTRLNIDTWGELAALRREPRTQVMEQPSPVDRDPEDVLYIEYTSGSTGRPKGVVVRHSNIQNTAMDLERRFPLRTGDVYLLKTAFTFDIFGTEIYGWLFGEGRLSILPVGHEGDALAVLSAVRDRRITHVNFSPTMLRVVLDAARSTGRVNDLTSLRYLFSGGEALTADIVERFFQLPLQCSLENVYGPTEASMWATHTTVTADTTDAIAPIGTPLNDYRIYVLDSSGGLCDVDLPGELCIAGAGVAVGYLNRDELSARQFVANPFFDPVVDPAAMARLYRTGDLGYLREDGRFAFVRRIDRQVKVGGLRMELGEIEQALLQVEGVVEAAVLLDDEVVPARLAGFFTAHRDLATDRVRAELTEHLMPHLIPSLLTQLEALPTSIAGKLDRRALKRKLPELRRSSGPVAGPQSPLQERIVGLWRRVLEMKRIDPDASFFDQGGSSLSLMRLQLELQAEFGREIPITELLKHHSVTTQARLFQDPAPTAPMATPPRRDSGDVAIIGIGIQVPAATDVHQFWANLKQGHEGITFYDDEELRALGIPESDLRDPAYVKARGRLADINYFDDNLFSLPPAEIEVTSPQLRLLYKCFWQACEDAGYDPLSLPGRVGVFAGGNDDFAWYQKALVNASAFGEAYQNFTLATNHFLSTRLSYHFDLTGPSLSALTGCSTSLLTVHLAVQSLRAGECDLAVAGGVTLELPNEGGYHYVDGMMLSRDGHCRPFDADASGTVFSNGAALLLLKPTAAAVRDGDPIYAVIKGSAVGNDGKQKLSYTAPSEEGQYRTIRAAYETSGIDPSTVTFLEAHGTGTVLGDPIEVASLSRAFDGAPNGGCLLGSVKGNVGHTDSAAGAVGLSKVALSLKHRYLPGTRNYAHANPNIDFAATPFRVTAEGRLWRGEQLRAGINSFGVGGTNVHMIVEEPPAGTRATPEDPYELLQFSAASPEALAHTSERVVRYLAEHEELSLSDAAHTLRRGRAQLAFRKSMVVAVDEVRDADAWAKRIAVAGTGHATGRARTALLFSGQGNQHHAMGRGLYRSSSRAGQVFRRWMDDLMSFLPGAEAATFRDILHGDGDDGRINRTEWTQFALFSTQYAMAKVLESVGVTPEVLVGHSIGELTAAALAGVWSLEDAARLVRERGKLMQSQQPGLMIAVAAPAERVAQAIEGLADVWVSLDNSAERSVLGMTGDAFDSVVQRLEDRGIRGFRLHTSHAFHTPMMAGAAEAFTAAVADVESRDPLISIISNRSGLVVQRGEMTDPAYWGDHITGAVQFTKSLRTLLSGGPLHAVELGPGPSLSTFAFHDPDKQADQIFVNALRHAAEETPDEAYLLNALGTLWNAGLTLDRGGSTGRRVSLPGYVFDRAVHAQDAEPMSEAAPRTQPRPVPVVAATAGEVLSGIQDAFRHVLGYRDIAPDDDFFALGGDSLKATALAAQLKSRIGSNLSVAEIFTAPTPSALTARLGGAVGSSGLRKAPPAEDYPLSSAQTRMYLAARMDPRQLTYNMPSATLLQGALDPERVRVALRRLIERHEPLRTTFFLRGSEVRQRVASAGELASLPLRFRRSAWTAEEAPDTLMADFVKPFDLATGPLFRMEIVDTGNGSLLLFDIHHIIADATSVEVLTRDFSDLYVGELDPVPLQYTDFVLHAMDSEHRGALVESEQHLAAALSDAPSRDLIVPDHPRGERPVAAGRVALSLGRDRLRAVQQLAEEHNATPFMVLLAAWGAVFSRYAECDDLVIGAPVTGRTLAETREMIGMFVNLMPIRLRPGRTTSFGDYLDATRGTVLDALTHQDVPFDQLVEKLNLPRVVRCHPLFTISFDYHNMDHHGLLIDGITAQPLDLRPRAVGMDLVITCLEATDGLTIHLDYAADLFDPPTIEALARHFEVLLDRVCADDSLRLAEIALYAEDDHAAIRERLTSAPFVALHQLIAQRAAETPDATAVIDADGQRYAYAQIDAMANAQASRLRQAGLAVGETVALFTVRDVNLLIAQLAILKAGGAYLPIDPAQPEERQRRILANLRPRFAFAPPELGVTAGIATMFDIRSCTRAILREYSPPAVGPDDLIYVLHTSGSTGAPKGIAVKHRGVFNLFRDHRERVLFGQGDVIISLADPTFDIFIFESLIPLASGASVHLCPAGDHKDAAAIATRIIDHGVTHIQAPVSKMTALCGNQRFRAQLPRLRVIVCGGEHFSDNLLSLLQQETGARVFNMYGPTETTVTATVKEFSAGDEVTIGSAVSGAEVLIVSDHGMIQPDGVPGELCILGEGLAAGYTNNPEETRRVFTTIAELPGVAVYRTGDAGVRLPSGEVVLTGRLDHQVKLNGNRIELGEIEKTAMRADGVSYAVATVEDGDLVLYYTTDGSDPSASIRSEIARSLPAYMKPQRFQQVDAMPKLANNKVDRRALPSMAHRRGTIDPVAVPPAPAVPDLLEEVLAAWEAVLGHPARTTDNFFDVGGNSYKLMLVNNRLSETLQTDVPLVTLFENPTPQSLAEALGWQEPQEAQPGQKTITLADLADFDDWTVAPQDEPQRDERPTAAAQKIAVIGMAAILPGATDIAAHWDNRLDGVVSVSRFTRDELLASGIDPATIDDPRYVNARGFVAADTFDAEFFEYSRRDAESMDPQLRLLHETAWQALEDAGYVPRDHPGPIALFAGSGTNFAWLAGLLDRRDDAIGAYDAMTMNEKDFLATKVAYKLNLTGTAVNVQTACSTSLVAIHAAVQCLRRGEADLALAGGVALNFPRREGYTWHEGMIFSRDGVCRPFSADADGTVAGQGCGVVLLKPLDRALADGDHIHAVIVGSATNNDGSSKVGYTAPSARGQERVIRAALADGGIDPDDVSHVETHGTGTKLGDPIEYAALSAVYGKARTCTLGAAKANIGHLDAAAGVAGFIGAVGVLQRGEVPPMANFSTLNENIEQVGSLHIPPARVATEGGVRLASVSSFGIGGTNAHMILEAAPPRPEQPAEEYAGVYLLPVSARTENSRRRMQEALEAFCRQGAALADVSHTLARGRAEFGFRATALAVPGQPMVWIEPTAAPLAVDASDGVRLKVSGELLHDRTALGTAFREAVEDTLQFFDDRLRQALFRAVFEESSAQVAIDRLAQFVIRGALLRIAGTGSLHARPGAARLLRIAVAFDTGEIGPGEAVQALRSGTVPARTPEMAGPLPTLVDGALDLQLLRRLLASQWVHGAEVDRARFCATGRRVPIPGYAFEKQPLVSDIRLSDLRVGPDRRPESTEPSEPTHLASFTDVLREVWFDVLGTDPAADDDFLRSGGDSLTAVQFCAILEKRIGISLTVGEVFADARFAAISALAASRDAEGHEPADFPGRSVVPAASSVTSPAQRRMYAVCALQRDTTAYNLALAYEVTGRLDFDRLRAIFRQLVDRHDQLRTSFHLEEGVLEQRVHSDVPDVVSVIEVSREEAMARLAAEPRRFDLATAPLLRVEVLAVDAEQHYLLIDLHHIVGDQQSLAVLAEDIADALQGRSLTPVPLRYADYVEELARLEETGSFDADIEFFTTMLGGDLPRLELPTDRTAPEPATFAGARHSFVASVGRQAITALAHQCRATPYMVFLAALTRLLGLYSGQREFVLGTAVSGRLVPGTERTVGMFVNTLPLRVSDAAERTVAEAVSASKEAVLGVLNHQNAPFEAVLARSGIRPGGDAHPLFDVLFNYVNAGTEELELDGVRLTPLPPGEIRSRYALSVSVAEGEDFTVDLEYRTELFDPRTIARIAGQLDHLLGEMVRDPGRRVADLDLETTAERRSRRSALTAAGPVIDESLLDRVRVSFATHAALPALRWGPREWTYAEVDRITDALAGGLQAVGVGEGDVVLCLLDRGPWQVFTRVALTKRGAVEISLDAQVPAERLADTLEDSGAKVVLCSDPQAHPWPEGVLAYAPEEVDGEHRPPVAITAASPLSMIYTSGTTGRPKGTLVTHGGVLSTCTGNGYMDYQPGERILQLTSFTFDPSLLDLYSAFLSGATLVMGRHSLNLDMKLLAEFLASEQIDKGILITAVFHLLMAENPTAVAGLSALYVGGEAMQPWAAKRAFDVLGPGRLYNLYGPTEASICTTWFRVDESPDFLRMPIGFPAHNRELYIVHPDGTDVPRGVPGELCVAGPSLAIGYHRRAELTAERFVEALGRIPHRLYRTGDRVVLDDADRIVYIDRLDRQIKHAGYRVELSEIELALQRCPGVVEAVVLHTKEANDSRLTAFYSGAAAPAEDDLRQELSLKVPRYMLPQRLIRLAELPLTAHGKVDRTMLSKRIASTDGPPVAAPGANQEILAAFRAILGVPDLKPSDDFFRAGAQSLQAIAVVRRLRESGMDLQVSDVYRYPTAEALSTVLRRAQPITTEPTPDRQRITLQPEHLRQLVGWAVGDGRRTAEVYAAAEPAYSFEAGPVARLHRRSGLETGGFMMRITDVDVEDLKEALASLVSRHEVLRARVGGDCFEILPDDAFAGLPALLSVQDLRRLDSDQLREFVDLAAPALQEPPFSAGLLWRVVIVRESDRSLRLVWAFHHSIFDGFSAGILRDEILRLVQNEDMAGAQKYSRFLTAVGVGHDWPAELESFDYAGWLASNRAVTSAVTAGRTGVGTQRRSIPLNGENPLDLALRSAYAQLAEISDSDRIAVGFVNDCRRWKGQDFTNCLGEFLDAVPVFLHGDGDHEAVTERLAQTQDRGVHYVHSLSEWSGDDKLLKELRDTYCPDRGKLGLTLVNFQGYLPPDGMPAHPMGDSTLALAHLNLWYDDDSLHLQWQAAGATTEALGDH